MTSKFQVGDRVIAHIPGNNPKRGILTAKADGFQWGIYRVAYELHGETHEILTTRIEHEQEGN